MITKKKCFVTGGAGYIGSNLVDRLIDNDNIVTVFDNLSSGELRFISHHNSNPNFSFIEADLTDTEKLNVSMQNQDIVFHFAANPDVIKGLADPGLDFRDGTIITFNVLNSMRINNISKIVFASSGTVYGDASNLVIEEDYGPILPTSLYGANKVCAEALVSGFSHIFDINAYIFRFANIVGQRQNHGVIYDFIRKLRKDPTKLLILGNGKQSKHYVHVNDLLDCIFFVLDNSNSIVNYFNISNESPIDVDTIAKVVMEEMNLNDVGIDYTGGSGGWKGDIPISYISPKKANMLGWRAKYDSLSAVRLATKQLIIESKE